MRNVRGLSLAGLLVIGGAAYADTPAAPAAPPAPTGPSLSDVFTASGLTVTGYVAADYEASSSPEPSLHQFDIRHSSFVLDQAAINIAMQPKQGFGYVVGLIAGEDARVLNAAESSDGGAGSNFNVNQAFVQYATGNWTLMGGKFVTLAGAEVINPTLDTNFSRSLLFFASPLTHTGFRASYAVNDQVTLIAGVDNGWNHIADDFKSQKTAEVGLSYTPVKAFVLTVQGYFGDEAVGAADSGQFAQRDFVDAVGTYTVSDSLSLVLNADYGQQKNFDLDGTNGKWDVFAGYVNYAINSQWRVSVRGEYLQDKQGFVTGFVGADGSGPNVWEGTVTFGYDPTKNFELRFEARYDKSNSDEFVKDLGTTLTDGEPTFNNDQTGGAIQAVYKF